MSFPHIQEPNRRRKSRNNGSVSASVDPADLIRRLSIVQAEEALRELVDNQPEDIDDIERRREDWEADLALARREQVSRIRNRTQSAPAFDESNESQSPRGSIDLGPTEIMSTQQRTKANRRTSFPAINTRNGQISQHAVVLMNSAAPRRPSYDRRHTQPRLRRDSRSDLETIEENDRVIARSDLGARHASWQPSRRRSSTLAKVNEDAAPDFGYGPMASAHRRRSSAIRNHAAQDWSQSDEPMVSGQRRRSSAIRNHAAQDWSQSDETSRSSRRRSSLVDKVESYWKARPDDDGYRSDDTTLANSKRSSKEGLSGTISRRRSSIMKSLKTVEEYWVVKPPPADEEVSVTDVYVESDASGRDSPKPAKKSKKLSLFSKLKL